MSHDTSHRIEDSAGENLEESAPDHQGQREVAELQRLFEDVTGAEEVVDEQDTSVPSREATDDSSLSTEAIDDGLNEAIDEPDVNEAL